ncbi:MAG: hypothetical protein ACI9PP_002183, partial [Halobacteriales archaeon]
MREKGLPHFEGTRQTDGDGEKPEWEREDAAGRWNH